MENDIPRIDQTQQILQKQVEVTQAKESVTNTLRPISSGESNLIGIESFINGKPFDDFYNQCRQHYASLPPINDFFKQHEDEIGLMEKAADLQYQWCIEANKELNQRYGKGNYYVVTAERGARNIRYMMSLLGLDVKPLWANGRFFLEDSPYNWDDVTHYFTSQHLNPEAILQDQRQLVMLDTGFVGKVIKGFMEYSALNLPSAEKNTNYADRILSDSEDAEEIVIVGEADYGLKAQLQTRGIKTSDFTLYKYRLASLEGPEHIDSILDGDKRIAQAIYDQQLTTVTEKLEQGQRLLFVTTEVDPNLSDHNALLAYLSYKGLSARALHRNITQDQRELFARMNGYMVTANSDSYYGELIDPNLHFARRAQLMENGPTFTESVSREQIKAGGKLEFNYLPAEDQLLASLYIDKITRRVNGVT